MSSRTRNLLVMATGILVALALLGYLSTRTLHQSVQGILEERRRQAELAAAFIDHHVSELFAALQSTILSEKINPRSPNLKHQRDELRELYSNSPFTYDVFLTDANGTVLVVEPKGRRPVGADLSRYPYVQKALRTGQPQASNLIESAVGEQMVLAFVVPIKDSHDAVVGLLGGELDPTSAFAGFLPPVQVKEQAAYVQVVDGNGRVIAHSEGRHLLQRAEHADVLLQLLKAHKAGTVTRKVVEAGKGSFSEVIAFAPSSVAPWGVFVEEPEAQALALVRNLRREWLLVGLIVLIVAMSMHWMVMHTITVSVRRLLRAAQRIAGGDLTTPVEVQSGYDEIAELAEAFEEMRQQLLAWSEELERRVQERTRRLSTLYTIDRAVAQSLELEKVLGDALDATLETLGMERGAILLLEPEAGDGQGERLVLRVCRGLSDSSVSAAREVLARMGDAQRVARMRSPLVQRLAEIREQVLADLLRQEGLQTLVSTPLIGRGRVLGLLTLGGAQEHELRAGELELLTAIGQQLGSAIQNAQLYAEAQRRLAALEGLHNVSAAVVSELDLKQVLDVAVKAAARLVQGDTVSICLIDADGKSRTHVAVYGEHATWLQGRSAPVGSGITGLVIESGHPLRLADVREDARVSELGQEMGIVSAAIAPLRVRGRVIGTLAAFRSTEGRPFSAQDEFLLTSFADQVAIAIHNAQLLEQEQQRASQLSALLTENRRRIAELATLNRLGRTLVATLELDELLSAIHHEVASVMPVEAIIIGLYDAEADEVDYRIRIDRDVREPPQRRQPIGLSRQIIRTGKPILIRDWQREKGKYPRSRPWGTMEAPDSWLGVPMKVGERVVGLIFVQAYRPHAYDEGHLDLLSTIADMAAVAVERAQLYQDMNRRLEELSALFEVGQAVTAALRLQDVLDLVVQVAPRVLHAEGGWLFLWDERAQRLVLRASLRGPAEAVGRQSLRQGEGLAGWVFVAGEPANVPDVSQDPRWKDDPESKMYLPSGHVQSALVVPLKVGDKVLGVLGVANKIESKDGKGEAASAFTPNDESLLLTMAGQIAIAIENARLYEDVRELSLGAVRALVGAIDARDPYTRGHSEEVTRLVVAMARELGWSGADLEMLEFAALLHDVGKIGVPDRILRKTSRLTPEEWQIIRLHPYQSAQIVKPVEPLQRIVPWVYHHHERWDGSGYPDGLRGEEIPLASRIIAVADTYNAMTTDRPYRPAMSHEEAVAELKRNAGTQFDPQVVEAFLRVVGERVQDEVFEASGVQAPASRTNRR